MKNFIVLSLIVVLQVLGNVSLSHGMRHVGEIEGATASAILAFGIRAVTDPWVLIGVSLLIGFFTMYLTALSRLDLSYVLPMTASTYILTALFAWLILGESVSINRWVGTAVVSIGILLVGHGEHKREQRKRLQAAGRAAPVIAEEAEGVAP